MKRKKRVSRISKRHVAIAKAEERVEPDLRYWAIHALHWHAFLVAVVAVLTVGYMYFNKGA
jgi:hypothetical protein